MRLSGSGPGGYRTGSFLWTAHGELGDSMLEVLKQQYNSKGLRWMEKHWGYHRAVIRRSLIKLGIETTSRYKRSADIRRKVSAHGGIEAMLRKYGSVRAIRRLIGCSESPITKLLKEKGYKYNHTEGKWEKCEG